MDITFPTGEGRFNYRVCALILHEGKILAMKDERSPYYYLPGGRVALHERAEDALLREMREELNVEARILRPLWLNESFFVEDVNGERFHELCLYFLVDVSHTDLVSRGERFVRCEGRHTHEFTWLAYERLRAEYFYPVFLKEKIFDLPDSLELLTTTE